MFIVKCEFLMFSSTFHTKVAVSGLMYTVVADLKGCY
jgi:hypothetical protein